MMLLLTTFKDLKTSILIWTKSRNEKTDLVKYESHQMDPFILTSSVCRYKSHLHLPTRQDQSEISRVRDFLTLLGPRAHISQGISHEADKSEREHSRCVRLQAAPTSLENHLEKCGHDVAFKKSNFRSN